MTMSRPSMKIDANNGGSDLAGETAAAMASTAILFKDVNQTYADELIQHAKELFQLADQHRKAYHESIPNAASFYRSFSGYKDELVWAAIWLYKATGEEEYKTKAQSLYDYEAAGGRGGHQQIHRSELVEEGRGMDSAHLPLHRRDGALPEGGARQRDRRVQAVQEDRDQGCDLRGLPDELPPLLPGVEGAARGDVRQVHQLRHHDRSPGRRRRRCEQREKLQRRRRQERRGEEEEDLRRR